jgi:dolichyl-phosphate beta-glucosyltransferase
MYAINNMWEINNRISRDRRIFCYFIKKIYIPQGELSFELLQVSRATTTGISIIIPAYNEEKRIHICLQRVLSYCINKNWDFEIVVVADGCFDNTAEIVNSFHLIDSRIHLISPPDRLGKGGAISFAALHSITKEYMAFLDADLAADPSQLEQMIQHIDDQDIVIGSRILRGDLPNVERPFHRTLLSLLFSKAFRVLFRIPIYDPQCGVKLFRSSILPTLFENTTVRGFAFDTDMIVTAYSLSMRVKEIPVEWVHGKSTTLNVLSEIRAMGLDLLSIWYSYHLKWRRGETCYPQKKGSIMGKGLFILLTKIRGVRTRPQKYLNHGCVLAEHSV